MAKKQKQKQTSTAPPKWDPGNEAQQWFQSCSVLLRLQQKADSLKGTRKQSPQKIPMVIKQTEGGLHLMSVALNIVLNFWAPSGPGIVVGERVTGIDGMRL
jgi:hypothetical protein